MNTTSFVQRWCLMTCLVLAVAVAVYCYESYAQERKMSAMPPGLIPFNVAGPIPECARWKDSMPSERNAEAYRIYIEARRLWRSKAAWMLSRSETSWILENVKTAAHKGDWGARALLARFYRNGFGSISTNRVLEEDTTESVAIVKMAVDAGQAWAYYDMGVAYERGYGKLARNSKIAWAYYLKAAQLGSPDAQMALGNAYSEAGRQDAWMKMIECAYRQEHGPAAYALATQKSISGFHDEALKIYQNGIKFGDELSAAFLFLAFREGGKFEEEILVPLGLHGDAERWHRYDMIDQALNVNPDLRLGRLDKVVPLPPNPLPPWNGVQDALTPEPEGPPTY